ncbi:MAG: TetR/AcrR family transcriptional regulator [Marmoricola sp.]
MSTSARTYNGKSAQQRATERRARLVDAAIDVLAEHGEAGATMTAICNRARLTERYFYESFPNRSEALLAAMDHVAAEIAGDAVRVLTETPGAPEERVRAVMTSFIAYLVREPAKGLVVVVHASISPALRSRRHELLESFAALVSTEAAELYGDDAWPPERAQIHGLVYISGLAELFGAWLTGRVTLSEDQLVQTASDLFVAMARRP